MSKCRLFICSSVITVLYSVYQKVKCDKGLCYLDYASSRIWPHPYSISLGGNQYLNHILSQPDVNKTALKIRVQHLQFV
jgi:hypothetical protein